MTIVYCVNNDINSKENTKHVIKFFGIFGFIKANVLEKEVFEKPESKFNTVEYYFDYPYFSEIVNPEYFPKELNNRERKFTRTIATLWLCSAISFMAFAALSYLAYKNQKSMKILTGLAAASLTFSILSSIFFVVGLLWTFFDFAKKKLVKRSIENHLIKNCLKDSPELVKKYRNAFIGEKQEDNDKGHDQESEKNKDIEDIMQFCLERKKVLALFKFLINGEKLVQAGMAMVNMQLLAGKHPNDIILDTNSLGGGIAAEVLRRFEEKGIYLTLIHSNSYSSLKDATNNFPYGIGNFFTRRLPAKILNFWFTYCGLDFNPEEVIKGTKCPVLIVGRKGDPVIKKPAQLADKLEDLIILEEKFRLNVILEHDHGIKNCSNEKNIHADHEEHLIWNNEDNKESERYTTQVKSDFIELAHGYLTSYGLNEKFDLEEYRKSAFSNSLTEVELQPFESHTQRASA